MTSRGGGEGHFPKEQECCADKAGGLHSFSSLGGGQTSGQRARRLWSP